MPAASTRSRAPSRSSPATRKLRPGRGTHLPGALLTLCCLVLAALGTAHSALAAGSAGIPASSPPATDPPHGATGIDVSYPQCGTALPAGQAFAIVGVNQGVTGTVNPCLGPSLLYPGYGVSELYWSTSNSTGAAASAPARLLYVNTADPGDLYAEEPVPDWPRSGSTPYGRCLSAIVHTAKASFTLGANSEACAWEYGYERAAEDVIWLSGAAQALTGQQPPVAVSSTPASYTWWLDVELANSWQSGPSGTAMNAADLQGMVAGFSAAGVHRLGVYSTALQWRQITGGTRSSGPLYGLLDWIPGAITLAGAQANCSLPSFTGGAVTLTQWLAPHSLDGDYAC